MRYILPAFIFLIIFFLPATSSAQFFTQKSYPKNYFQWPIGAKIALAANFGELRSNHFHMGLDCKSDQVQNKPVYAAADGYIARIKVEPWGFGRAIYINHPNGYTTLYAHLNEFYPELEKYVQEQQYKMQKWNIFLENIPPNLFPVQKGKFIANSGNTGGSQGPHLHFEIRDTKTDKVLNPLLFGFPVVDNIPPDVLRVAVYDRNKSTYEQTPKIYPLKKVNGVYVPAGGKIIVNTDKVSFSITGWDKYTGSTNQNGIFSAVLYHNQKTVSGFQLDNIDYIETRELNAHTDYRTRFFGGPWLQHLSPLPGLESSIYKTDENNGIVILKDTLPQKIKIDVSDANGNTSVVAFDVINTGKSTAAVPPAGSQVFQPGMTNIFDNGKVGFYLAPGMIYDAVNFQFKETPSVTGEPVYAVHNPSVPLKTYYTIKIKSNPVFQPSKKMVIKRFYNASTDFKKAEYENGWYKASFREFGHFQLKEDNTPPVIATNGFTDGINATKLGRIIFSVTDDSEDIDSFNAWLDGKWLLFSNDKGKNFIYKFDEHCPPGPHELKVEAIDIVGNTTTKTFLFTR